MAESSYPKARREKFIVQPMDGEVILYDGDVTHLLNATAASVWQKCDGHHSVAAMARELALDEETVLYTLQQLERKQLLQENSAQSIAPKSMTRREFLKKGAIVAVTIPVVKTILLPTPAHAQSGGPICKESSAIASDCSGPLPKCIDGCCVYPDP